MAIRRRDPVEKIAALVSEALVAHGIFFHWSDRQSLEQALAIARHQPVKLGEVARWAKREPDPAAERYQVFAQRLQMQKK
jgi:hypothetical protein